MKVICCKRILRVGQSLDIPPLLGQRKCDPPGGGDSSQYGGVRSHPAPHCASAVLPPLLSSRQLHPHPLPRSVHAPLFAAQPPRHNRCSSGQSVGDWSVGDERGLHWTSGVGAYFSFCLVNILEYSHLLFVDLLGLPHQSDSFYK